VIREDPAAADQNMSMREDEDWAPGTPATGDGRGVGHGRMLAMLALALSALHYGV
jgi:hypothetical protein